MNSLCNTWNARLRGSEKTEKMKPVDKDKFDEVMKKYNINLSTTNCMTAYSYGLWL